MNCRLITSLLLASFMFASAHNLLIPPAFLPTKKTFTVVANTDFVYGSLNAKNFAVPKLQSFTEALSGFYNLKAKGLVSKNIITLIDFSLPSNAKRLWVIDVAKNVILFNTFVSHGINSGLEYANSFSNIDSSKKSSLGFYATGEAYIGKHGFSLKLDGLEKGVNNNARSRAVVVHGADYANASVFNSQHFLGRSQGCPALPENLSKQIINTIKGKSCLFIYHPSRVSRLARA